MRLTCTRCKYHASVDRIDTRGNAPNTSVGYLCEMLARPVGEKDPVIKEVTAPVLSSIMHAKQAGVSELFSFLAACVAQSDRYPELYGHPICEMIKVARTCLVKQVGEVAAFSFQPCSDIQQLVPQDVRAVERIRVDHMEKYINLRLSGLTWERAYQQVETDNGVTKSQGRVTYIV